ncbi:MAG: hypothetical protein QNJ42_16810 [Crocosphaera sp.]|nr:hypothetical protein [Crocosphaera sp.]
MAVLGHPLAVASLSGETGVFFPSVELTLAIAVIESVETRAQRSQHNTERFLFNSA